MSNTIGWGKGASNNSIGWGNVGTNGFGSIYSMSNSGETDLASAASIFQDAAVAYSLRDLGLGATSVVRVRRSLDNIEQDFTATEITDGTLLTFCGGGEGFVSVWYDQKGQFNFTQPTALKQPQIVSLGSVNLLNGKPIIKRVSDDGTMLSSYPLNGNNRQVFFVGEMTYANQQGCLIGSEVGGADYNLISQQASTSLLINNSSTLNNEKLNGYTFNYTNRGDIYNSFLEQRLLSYNADFNFFDNRVCLGYRPGDTAGFGMYDMQELILFETPKNVEEIEAKINNHYAIY